ncbi:MAG TPA: hypothetical protein DET40_18685 [Lentisphaeria bacterium]|nr:MAG: hypothetical protein A2X45_25680 [Lentisphaerae bacterium GWF2_50_93]HCE45572.1 hypothetical protein [Lentisphaeria bacterium]
MEDKEKEDKSEKSDIQNKQDKREETINKISNTAKIFSFVSVTVVFLLVIIIVISMYSSSRKAEAARLTRIENERISAQKLAKEQALKAEQEKNEAIAKIQKESWEKAIGLKDAAINDPAQINSAITKMNEIKSSMPGTEYEKKADAEILSLQAAKQKAIDKVLADLTKKAEEPAGRKDFEAAADIFKNYSGPLSQETNEERLQTAEKHLASAREAIESKKEFQQAKNELLKSISSLIIKNKAADALASYNDFKTKYATEKTDDIGIVKNILETIQAPDKYILESCRSDIGKKIIAKTDGPYESVEISRIKDDNIYVKKAMGTATMETKISLANISPEEKVKRSDKMDKASRAVFVAVIETELGNYDNAEKALEPNGLLTEHLSVLIKERKKEIEDKKAADANRPIAKEDSTPKEFVVGPQHINIKADANTKNTSRETLLGDIYMLQDIVLKVSVSSSAPVDFTGNKIEIYVLGENTADKHICQVLAVEKKDLNLKKKETLDLDVKAASEFNKLNVNKYGAEYCGYFIVIKDKGGKVFAVKTNKAPFQKLTEKILKMDESYEFDDRTGEEMKGVPPPRRR